MRVCRAGLGVAPATLPAAVASPLAATAPQPPTRDRERGGRGYLTDGGPRMRALAAAATAVAAPTPARLRFRLPLLPRAPRSGEFASPFALLLPEPAAPTASARRGGTRRGDFRVGLGVSATRGLGFRVWWSGWR